MVITITKPGSVSALNAFANYRANNTNNAASAIQKQLEYQRSINNRNDMTTYTLINGKYVQTSGGNYTIGGLSQATIKAQQALSEKYGIPTFDIKGNVSTVPTSGLSNLAKTVGVGIYKNDSAQSFTAKLQNVISSAQSTGGLLFNTVFNPPSSTNPSSQTPSGDNQGAASPSNTQPPSGSSSIGMDIRKNLDGIKNYIGPTGILIGVGLVALFILKPKGGG